MRAVAEETTVYSISEGQIMLWICVEILPTFSLPSVGAYRRQPRIKIFQTGVESV